MNKEQQKQAQEIAELRLKQKQNVDKDQAYAEGFTHACEEHGVDPLQVVEIANTLDIHL